MEAVGTVRKTMPSVITDDDWQEWQEWCAAVPSQLSEVDAAHRPLPLKMPMKCGAVARQEPSAAVKPQQLELIDYRNPGGRGAQTALSSCALTSRPFARLATRGTEGFSHSGTAWQISLDSREIAMRSSLSRLLPMMCRWAASSPCGELTQTPGSLVGTAHSSIWRQSRASSWMMLQLTAPRLRAFAG